MAKPRPFVFPGMDIPGMPEGFQVLRKTVFSDVDAIVGDFDHVTAAFENSGRHLNGTKSEYIFAAPPCPKGI